MTTFIWRETLMTHLLLWGNFYAQIVRDGRGYPIALYPLLPSNMSVDRNRDTKQITYTYHSDEGAVKLDRWHVLHVPGLGFDGLLGYSPIALAKNSQSIKNFHS